MKMSRLVVGTSFVEEVDRLAGCGVCSLEPAMDPSDLGAGEPDLHSLAAVIVAKVDQKPFFRQSQALHQTECYIDGGSDGVGTSMPWEGIYGCPHAPNQRVCKGGCHVCDYSIGPLGIRCCRRINCVHWSGFGWYARMSVADIGMRQFHGYGLVARRGGGERSAYLVRHIRILRLSGAQASTRAKRCRDFLISVPLC